MTGTYKELSGMRAWKSFFINGIRPASDNSDQVFSVTKFYTFNSTTETNLMCVHNGYVDTAAFTNPFKSLGVIATENVLENYSISDHNFTAIGTCSISSAITTNNDFVSRTITVTVSNSTESSITVNSLIFTGGIRYGISGSSARFDGTVPLFAYYLDTPIVLSTGESKVVILTITAGDISLA